MSVTPRKRSAGCDAAKCREGPKAKIATHDVNRSSAERAAIIDFVEDENSFTRIVSQPPRQKQGCPPPFAWETFRAEAADPIKNPTDAAEKEAAIQQVTI